jgi:hypothetical protein
MQGVFRDTITSRLGFWKASAVSTRLSSLPLALLVVTDAAERDAAELAATDGVQLTPLDQAVVAIVTQLC